MAFYLGPVPSDHPRAPLYSPLVWQIGADEPERARYNVVGPPCSRMSMFYEKHKSHPGLNQDCWTHVDSWNVQPDWPQFPGVWDVPDGRDTAGYNSRCLANPSGGFTFRQLALWAIADKDLRGLTWVNAAFFQLFIQDIINSFLTEELEAAVDLGEIADELLVWIDHVLGLSYWPNCDPDDANDADSPSVRCAAWSSTGICSYGITVTYSQPELDEGDFTWIWGTLVPCPVPFVGNLPVMDLGIEHGNDGQPLPGQKLTYVGWCQPAHTMWTPGGAATPPPGGEAFDVIKLPLDKTGFHRGYLINTDRVDANKLLLWSAQIELRESADGVVLELGEEPGGRELLASFELEVGDLVVAIGQVDLRGRGGVERMLETANRLLVESRVVNALVRRGSLALPTYVMRASYRR